MEDRFALARFKNAQGAGVYDRALQEIKNGRKQSHWMWYIFPQIAGLGHSTISRAYSIKSVEEARAYLQDSVLGPGLREICAALIELPTSDPGEVFGYPDWMKLGSSMTLFDYVDPQDIFAQVLRKYFSDSRDLRTLSIIRQLNH